MKRTFSISLAAALLLGASTAAVAQSDVLPDEVAVADNGEEIVVTAQKIEQRAKDVPITISAVTGDRMRELGVSDLDELSNYIPGLNVQEQSANNPGIVIRGITSDSGSAQQGARVSLYYNGVDISRSRGSYQDLYDMERIEVIKGPQATLFGTASAVGAISMISARPKAGVSGQLTAGLGNFDQRLLSGYFNAGSDVLAGRIAFAWKKRDGYVNNLAPDQDDLNGQDQLGIRGSLRYAPTDNFRADLILTYDRQRNPGTAFTSKALATPSGPGNPFGDAWLGGSPVSETALGAAKLGLHRDVYDANLMLSWDIAPDWTLTMVNGYRKFDSLEIFDADGSRAWYLEFGEDSRGEQGSHETRFSYNSDTFRGSFGWNAFREDNLQRVPFSTEEGTYLQCAANVIPGLGCINAAGVVTASQATALLTKGAATVIPYSSVFENQGKNDSYSMFADGTWIPTPRIEITAGVRALIEKRRSGFVATAPNSVLSKAPLIPGQVDTGGKTFRTEDSFQAFLPRANILFRFSDSVNGFATISKGRRSPTVNLGATKVAGVAVAAITPIAAENVWNYEIGLKGSAGAFSGSLGVYYQKYDNFQVSVIQADGSTKTESAGSASNFGIEAEAMIKPTSWLSLFGNIGYIDGGIDKKASIAPTYRGAKFRLQPEIQAAAGFTIDAPIAEGVRVFATPSVTYRGHIYFEVPNKAGIEQDAVTLVNVRAGVSFAEEKFEIAAFARNVTNKDYLLDAGNTGGGFGIPTFIAAEPRLYGVQASVKF